MTPITHDEEVNMLRFFLMLGGEKTEVLRMMATADGRFHVLVPDGVPMTEAAEQFVHVLQDQIPKLRLLVGGHGGRA